MIYPVPAPGAPARFTTKLDPAVLLVTCIKLGVPDTYSHDRRITELDVMFALEIVVLLPAAARVRP